MTPEIRTGGPADVPDILALLDAAVAWLAAQGRTEQWGATPWSGRPAAVERVERYAREYLVRIAADSEGRTIGSCILADHAPDYAPKTDQPELYVQQLVISREHRNSGVGAALIADARAEAARRGVGLLRVDCYAGPDRKLVGQYRALGFTETEPFEVAMADGTRWPGQVLEIRL
ncbi:GNAT family N-acetyltransferase [Streptomyces tateyamensis]|uniref:GNAT family N-acetyltransferase n=1 Tax=Streptomyces tateyamensis TaxID=565073 RepID=A0A2V4NKV6_9ACTN|nr:GNAT family N-acetyltransferase [Streptomyces tateyamensis]PYC85381.1 GNAT family N-acetyltransferase [Streptomyces tateyamensis]